MRGYIIVLIALILSSCENSGKKNVIALLQEWEGKKIIFPSNPVFTIRGEDTVDYQIQETWKILTYIDSTGCTGCKLNISEWQKIMDTVDSFSLRPVQFLFFLSPKNGMEIYQKLRVAHFDYPICVDIEDSLNNLNNFPQIEAFQTFLLDRDNKIIAIGNPVNNNKIKELYLKIIQGGIVEKQKRGNSIKTEVNIYKSSFLFGDFDWQKEQKTSFILKNVGSKPLLIEDVNTSCGCTTVAYSKEPAQPGKEIKLDVIYKADHPEYFNKTISVHCNTEVSPIRLTVSGNAK